MIILYTGNILLSESKHENTKLLQMIALEKLLRYFEYMR